MAVDWLVTLQRLAQEKPCVVLRIDATDWEHLAASRRGLTEFTIARAHSSWKSVRVPTLAIVLGADDRGHHALLGIASSKAAVSTLETRVKIARATAIEPSTAADLAALLRGSAHAGNLTGRLNAPNAVVPLSPMLSVALIGKLAEIEANHGRMRMLAEALRNARRFRGPESLQDDAVSTALKVFGLAAGEGARSLELVAGRDTALVRVPILEDAVVEHDARQVPGYDLVGSDLTGRAIFERDGERLEVITANQRPLEQVFGVDLVYMNLTKENVVMLQYKMLEPHDSGSERDWIYRPDGTLADEVARMERFAAQEVTSPRQYRLNPEVFFLKFVKRNGAIGNGGIVIPLQHYKRLIEEPAARGPRGGLRISYQSLQGRYLRQGPFLDLVRSGYVGAHAEMGEHLVALVRAVIEGERSVVAALHTAPRHASDDDIGHEDGGEAVDEHGWEWS